MGNTESDRILSKYNNNKPCDCVNHYNPYFSCGHFLRPTINVSVSHLNWPPEEFNILLSVWINSYADYNPEKWWNMLSDTNFQDYLTHPNVVTNLEQVKKALCPIYEKNLKRNLIFLEKDIIEKQKTIESHKKRVDRIKKTLDELPKEFLEEKKEVEKIKNE